MVPAARQLTHPWMVLSGLQLSGVLLVTVEFFSVTLVLPVAIPPALEPVLNRTEVP